MKFPLYFYLTFFLFELSISGIEEALLSEELGSFVGGAVTYLASFLYPNLFDAY